MKAHKFAKYFPPMNEAEFGELVEDIRENGLIEPITTLEGKILDGVHRFKACKLAKVKPRYVKWTDSNPLKWVMSKNLHRRHLEKGQRVMVLIDAGLVDPSTGKGRPEKIHESVDLSAKEASEMAGTGTVLVEQVRTVAREAPELADEIRSGEKTANLAHMMVRVKQRGKEYGTPKEAAVLYDALEAGKIGHNAARDVLGACKVAYEHGDKGRVKELFKTAYNRHTHTSEAEKQRQEIAQELDQKKAEKRQKMRWEDVPQVASILRAFQNFRKAVPEFIKALEVGKFSPEAKQFLAEKLGELITEVRGLLKDLEDLKGRLQ